MKPLTLHPLCDRFLPAAVALDQQCFGGIWTLEHYQQELQRPESLLLTLRDPQAPPQSLSLAGLACLWSVLEEAHITLLAIAPAYRGQGWAQVLLGELLIQAHDRGLAWATLEVSTTNTPALNLYQKFGFQTLGVRQGYYQKTGEDAAILWLHRLQDPAVVGRVRAVQQQGYDRTGHLAPLDPTPAT